MSSIRLPLPFSLFSLCSGAVGVLSVVYIGLIAVVMSYAAFTVEFSQSVRDDTGTVAALESAYLTGVARITGTDYIAAGYAKPRVTFVPAQNVTALR